MDEDVVNIPGVSADLTSSGIVLQSRVPICQSDLPLDWYQQAFRPYAEEYLALPDRTPEVVLPWLDSYVRPAVEHFGDSLLLLAHFYMGGEIVKLIERYGGAVSDSYALALQAARHPEKSVIVESAVHFMAETISILADDHQDVWITNPKSGCTMEMMAKDWMIDPVVDQLLDRYGDELLVIAYMNTSGRIKAISGRSGGAVCTSSNAQLVMKWALEQKRRILFVPDHHLGRNTAVALGIPEERIHDLPSPVDDVGALQNLKAIPGCFDAMDDATVINWGSFCGVHTVFTSDQVRNWQEQGWTVLVHPESPLEVVQAADGYGSTDFLWKQIMSAPEGSRLAIGTEGHFVRNAAEQSKSRGVQVRHLTDHAGSLHGAEGGCGCATMSRNDPPHLAGMLDLLRRGEAPDINRVLPGDVVDEASGVRERLDDDDREDLVRNARAALDRMIEITESNQRSN